jgi:signal transduction histidine kinase
MLERVLNSGKNLSSREERAMRESVTQLLEGYGVTNAQDKARALIKVGLYENLEEFRDLFSHPRAEQLLELSNRAGRLYSNVSNIGIAVAKTQKIVYALKSYARRKADDVPEPASVQSTIETVLTVYASMLKSGINVHTDFDPSIQAINCFPDQLNQVWTNLLHNSIQAMGGVGEINIAVKRSPDNHWIEVTVRDSGPGIPPEILPRIFEPFFTTKGEGEGSGLGLDICRKIVQNHQGTIEAQSVPGNTAFTVRLPINGISATRSNPE